MVPSFSFDLAVLLLLPGHRSDGRRADDVADSNVCPLDDIRVLGARADFLPTSSAVPFLAPTHFLDDCLPMSIFILRVAFPLVIPYASSLFGLAGLACADERFCWLFRLSRTNERTSILWVAVLR